MEYITMVMKKAEIEDLNIVVKLKIDMFTEVGSISLLQDNAEEQIYEKYKELYQEGKGCHYLVYENDSVVACGGAVIKEDVPLLPQAGRLIAKYKNDPECLYRSRLLPVLSNQKYNEYLKEIAVLCGISTKLTTHVARHTYATRCLTLGVPIETVSKTMGHTNTRMTSHYAKITEAKILNEMYPLMR